jgi:hypothetical protein
MVHERFFHIPFSHLVVPKVLAFREDAQSSLFNRLMKCSVLDPRLRRPFAAYGRSTFKQNQLEMLRRTVLYENLRSKGCGKQKRRSSVRAGQGPRHLADCEGWPYKRLQKRRTASPARTALKNQPTDPAAAGRYASYL